MFMPKMLSPRTQHKIEEVLEDPSTSYWMNLVLKESLQKDVVDVLNDLEVLTGLMKDWHEDVIAAHSPSA